MELGQIRTGCTVSRQEVRKNVHLFRKVNGPNLNPLFKTSLRLLNV